MLMPMVCMIFLQCTLHADQVTEKERERERERVKRAPDYQNGGKVLVTMREAPKERGLVVWARETLHMPVAESGLPKRPLFFFFFSLIDY